MKPLIVRPGEGERIGGGPASATILATRESSNGAFTITDTTIPPGFPGPPSHSHRSLTDSFYVLDGTLTLTIDDELVEVEVGTYVSIPPGTIHTFSNRGRTPARFLNINTPGGWEDYLREIAELMKNGPPDRQAWRDVMSRHDFVPDERGAGTQRKGSVREEKEHA